MASKKRISMAESEMMSLGSEETTPLDNTLMGNIEALQNSFFGVTKTENDGIKEIAVSFIHAFKDHPFKVLENEDMDKLVESIKENGIYSPLLLRTVGPNSYECISGHRRLYAAKKAGLMKVPAIIREMSDDEAIVAMVDSNTQRETILPSERAFSLKMKMDALRRLGKEYAELASHDSIGDIAEQEDMGRAQVHRYIRLTNLLPELLSLVDDGRINFMVGVELSYLCKHMQKVVLTFTENVETIKPKHIPLLRSYRENETMTLEQLIAILNKPVVAKKKDSFSFSKKTLKTIPKYFPENYTKEQMEDVILSLLEQWKEENEGK